MFELLDTVGQQAVIKVIGVGGGGGNAVDHMVQTNIEGVEFINANTDAQALARSNAKTILQLGSNLTKGLGAGADPDVGRQAAMEDRDRISEAIEGADMVFITAGMGGGTGTGAAPIIAQIAREQNILAVAVVTRPFPFEGGMRMQLAEAGIADLGEHVDSLITIPNEKVLNVMGRGAPLLDAFAKANDVLLNAVQGISELITRPGLINVDFADVRAVMAEMGMAVMGSATAVGEDRAVEASRAAVSSPLLEDINLAGARGILVNVTAGIDFAIGEFEEVGKVLQEFASDEAKVVIGAVLDPDMRGELRVTMVATGIGKEAAENFPQRDKMRVVQAATTRSQQTNQQSNNVTTNTGAGDTFGNDRAGAAPNWRTDGSGGPASTPEASQTAKPTKDGDMGYLDIPAFLRKQAD